VWGAGWRYVLNRPRRTLPRTIKGSVARHSGAMCSRRMRNRAARSGITVCTVIGTAVWCRCYANSGNGAPAF